MTIQNSRTDPISTLLGCFTHEMSLAVVNFHEAGVKRNTKEERWLSVTAEVIIRKLITYRSREQSVKSLDWLEQGLQYGDG